MATRSLAGSIISFPCPTSLPGRSNLLERNTGKRLVPATGEVDLLDLPINFLSYLIRRQGLLPPASFTADRSPPINHTGRYCKLPSSDASPHGTRTPWFLADFFLRTSWAISASGTRHDPNCLRHSTNESVLHWHCLTPQASSNSTQYRHIEKPNRITIPYMVIGVNERDLQYQSILILLDGDGKLVAE
jgi:hypothetical protein